MYGRKAMGAADCMPGVSPRLRIAGPLYASSELAGAASSCAESDCAIRPSAHPKNRVVRTKSKAVLLDLAVQTSLCPAGKMCVKRVGARRRRNVLSDQYDPGIIEIAC